MADVNSQESPVPKDPLRNELGQSSGGAAGVADGAGSVGGDQSSVSGIAPGAGGSADELPESLKQLLGRSGSELRQSEESDQDSNVDHAWDEFLALQLDSTLFIKLLAICDFQQAEATVLWDLLAFHRRTKLDAFAVMSGATYHKKYPQASERSFRLAINELTDFGLIEQAPVVRNVSKRIRIFWPALAEQLAAVDPRTPGLQCQ